MYSIINLNNTLIFTTDNNYSGDSLFKVQKIFKVVNTDISLGYYGTAPIEIFNSFYSVNKLHTKRIISNDKEFEYEKIYSIIYSNTTPIWCISEKYNSQHHVINECKDFNFEDYKWCKENTRVSYRNALKDYIFFNINEEEYFYYLLQGGEKII